VLMIKSLGEAHCQRHSLVFFVRVRETRFRRDGRGRGGERTRSPCSCTRAHLLRDLRQCAQAVFAFACRLGPRASEPEPMSVPHRPLRSLVGSLLPARSDSVCVP
jgi:hypothetical protein